MKKKKQEPVKEEEIWRKLLEFVRSKCLVDTPEIDFGDFYNHGKDIFDVKPKYIRKK